ncbi:hypothetical protein [Curtobacterium sp. MCBD17_026]|uniref:ParB family protein n=1 Tax=Curtobacterium sp. MCBD17_026 TaxID=2175621 RepID=UPI000DA9F5B8|nr:hypothetical protein [Curtobacterium sp. MCBD17_026]WIB72579.1 hypothetical protein DEI85_17465 [Curtobacterium sp. MCBD17_026]
MATNKPERRRSTLGAAQPYAPTTPAAEPAAVAAQTPASPPQAAPVADDVTAAPSTPSRAPKAGKKPKVSFYQDPEDTARARAAMVHTQGLEGSRSWSEFVDRALMREAERLEKRYNGGQPWPPVEAGEIPRGRPMGS